MAHLKRQGKRSWSALETLCELLAAFRRIREPEAVFGELADLVAGLIGAQKCFVLSKEMLASEPFSAHSAARLLRRLQSSGPLIANRPAQIPFEMRRFARAFAIKNMLAAPMLAEDGPAGMVCAANKPRGFTRDDAHLLAVFAAQAVGILQRTQLYRKLAASEASYRDIFENAVVGIYRSTPEGRLIMVNPTMARLLGFESVEALLRCGALNLYEDVQARERWREELERKGMLESEARLRRRDESFIWTHDIARVARDEAGRVLYYEGTLTDITEQKRAEAERQAMFEIIQGVNATDNLDELFELIHRSLKKVLYAENCFVALYDRAAGTFSFPFFVDQFDPPPPPQRLEKSGTAYVFRTGRPMLVTKELFERLVAAGELELVGTFSQSWLGVPLKTPTETIGVLVVQHYEDEQAYSERDVEFLASVGGQIALAIERKRAEEALRKSWHLYHMLVESMSDVVLWLDPEGRITYINPAVERTTGYNPQEVIGRSFADFVHPEDLEAVRELIALRLNGDTRPGEFRYVAKNGEVRFLQSSGRPLVEQGKIVGISSILRDVTEQRHAEACINSIYEVMTRYQGQELFDRAAQTLAQLLGMQYALIGEVEPEGCSARALAFYHDGIIDRGIKIDLSESACESVIRESRLSVYPERVREIFPDSERLIAWKVESYIGAPITDSSGAVIGIVNAFSDRPKTFTEADMRILQIVGQRVAAEIISWRGEEAQRRLQEQLFQAQKMESVGTLAGGVAHDFNNLLTGIMGFTELALSELGEGSKIADYLKQVLSLSERARDLVRRLLLFSRPSAVDKAVLDLHAFLKDAAALLGRTIPENIEIKLDLAPDKILVEANPLQLEQVLLNLAVNARDAMPEGGLLAIETARVPQRDEVEPTARWLARLTVSDTGTGIRPDVMPHIFEPFFTTKEVGKGTGLGLSVVYGIVKAHGGWIEVESEVGRGSSFHVYLPGVEKEAGQPLAASEPLPPGGHETVMIVEDEPSVVELGRTLLERLGYQVLIARNGSEALALYAARKGEIDLVMLDLVMSQMGGKEVFAAIRAINPQAKVLLVTGYGLGEMAEELMAQGAAGLVQKPYDIKTLAHALRRCLYGG